MTQHDALVFLVSLATLLGAARIFGELARGIGFPLVVGEIVAGVLLGPTILGRVTPAAFSWLFGDPRTQTMIGAYSVVAVLFLLVAAGLEVDASVVRRRGRIAAWTSILAILLPLAGGILLGFLLPGSDLLHPERRTIFAFFLGAALTISALPIIAKTLLDLGLFKTDIGLLVMAVAMIVDVIAWLAFSILVGPIQGGFSPGRLGLTLLLTLGFVLVSFTLLRRVVDNVVGRIEHEQQAAPERVLSLVIVLALIGGAVTQAIGVHAVFGAFVVGLTVSASPRLKERTRMFIHQFVTNIFAPIFFAAMGLRIDVARAFDLRLCVLVFVVATVTKVLGATIGARVGGIHWREATAVGVGLNAHGAMGIIFSVLAFDAGLISDRVLVALVSTALVTTIVSGPVMKRLLFQRKHEEDVVALLRRGAFVPALTATTPSQAIEELVEALTPSLADLTEQAKTSVLERELVAPTGLGDEVAIPHAAVQGLTEPVLALGRTRTGIDFDAPDGKPAKIIFLLLMPPRAYEQEVRVLASVARSIFDARARQELLDAPTFDGVTRVLRASARRVDHDTQQHGPSTPNVATR